MQLYYPRCMACLSISFSAVFIRPSVFFFVGVPDMIQELHIGETSCDKLCADLILGDRSVELPNPHSTIHPSSPAQPSPFSYTLVDSLVGGSCDCH